MAKRQTPCPLCRKFNPLLLRFRRLRSHRTRNRVGSFEMSIITKETDLRRKGERGSVIIMTAISMVFLFLLVGLCIDVSRIYMVRAELQNAADAAALTAARELNAGTGGIDDAVTRANAIVNTRGFNKVGVTVDSVEFATSLYGTYMNATDAKA